MYDDQRVLDLLKAKYYRVNVKGVTTYSKANRLYNIFKLIRMEGYEVVRNSYAQRRTFDILISQFSAAGISKAFLQSSTTNTDCFNLSECLDVRLDNQSPPSYTPLNFDSFVIHTSKPKG